MGPKLALNITCPDCGAQGQANGDGFHQQVMTYRSNCRSCGAVSYGTEAFFTSANAYWIRVLVPGIKTQPLRRVSNIPCPQCKTICTAGMQGEGVNFARSLTCAVCEKRYEGADAERLIRNHLQSPLAAEILSVR